MAVQSGLLGSEGGMNLPLPNLEELRQECGCERPRSRMDGRCRDCGGVVPSREEVVELPYSRSWWPLTEENVSRA